MAVRELWVPPASFDEYQLLEPIGRGGMGQVWLARDIVLERAVAVKFISQVQPSRDARERFLTEARAAARLQHPNVVTVYRVGEIAGRPYIVSELVRGKSLDVLEAQLPLRQVLDLSLGLVRGLAAAHRRGVLHRDIKPANVIIAEDGTVKLLDFGLAKLSENELVAGVAPEASPEPARPLPIDGPVPDSTIVQPGGRRLTAAGAILGTPHYMPPEVWRGEPATRVSDIYSLGVVLYELTTGKTPFDAPTMRRLARLVQEETAPDPRVLRPDLEPGLAEIIQRCIRRDPAERFATADELLDALEQLTPMARAAPIPEGNPYRGLQAFEAEHRSIFFGRSGEIRMILDRLRSDPFVLVAGDSGVGKSSLCRAGVLPLVADGALGTNAVRVARMVPGHRPVTALASALAAALEADDEEILALLKTSPGSIARTLKRRLGPKGSLLLFVDQMEELVTLSATDELEVFGHALGSIATGVPGLRLLGTVRGDFLTRLASVPELGYEITRALYILRPLGPDRIREIIEGPALATGVRFESDELVDTLVRSSTGGAGLPLLQFTLAELWDARDPASRMLTSASLHSLGGVAGALARHADSVLERLPPEQRVAARGILMRLVTPDGTRARASEADLVAGGAAAQRALEALVRARLLVARDGDGETTVEVAHEALLADWTTLREWLAVDADARAARHRLELASAEWERLGRAREALWSERQTRELAALDDVPSPPLAAAFLAASRRAVRRRRWVRLVAVLALPLLLGALWSVVRVNAHRALAERVQARLSQAARASRQARAMERQASGLRGRALGRFDAGELDGAEELWSETRALEKRSEGARERAGSALEAAVLLDATGPRARSRLADLLLDRIRSSERDGAEPRTDLLRRLSLYDASGWRRRWLDRPASLAVRTDPAAAHVVLERFERDGRGLARVVTRVPLQSGVRVRLEPGSWRVVATAPERATVRAPILLRRGESLDLPLFLPAASAVPPGLEVVPRGRFLFGSSDEGLRRGFFNTVPLHTVWTAAYLIARHETTFAEWIAYLEALPVAERERRTPRVTGSGAFQGSLELRQEAGGSWRLTVQPTSERLSALQGEPLVVPARSRRRAMDWGRLPVSGITWEDAIAYTAWLDRTGRLPGARPCDEREWERAARGADGRLFPHGDRLHPDDANFDRTYGKELARFAPDEVGAHPASGSPFAIDDMAGNVWEWAASAVAPGEPVARGGAYYFDEKTGQSANRETVDPTLRDVSLGLRVCAALPR